MLGEKIRAQMTNRVANMGTTASGSLSFLGGYNVCHNLCLGIIAGLSMLGISLQGMPLAFLQDYAIPLWSLAILLLGLSLYFYTTRKCISKNMLIGSTGLLIAAIPFKELEAFSVVFWITGGVLVAFAIINFIKNRYKKGCCK